MRGVIDLCGYECGHKPHCSNAIDLLLVNKALSQRKDKFVLDKAEKYGAY